MQIDESQEAAVLTKLQEAESAADKALASLNEALGMLEKLTRSVYLRESSGLIVLASDVPCKLALTLTRANAVNALVSKRKKSMLFGAPGRLRVVLKKTPSGKSPESEQ